ncbi:MAG: hypothetical protein US51_C0008G0003 [Microgenomates group bacterium GW2011_GWA2_37_6]|nr:MAG: hypothetical protein US51_C0008G0003 [Microgenomates group bacterium GW2011_GWA2_37_6]
MRFEARTGTAMPSMAELIKLNGSGSNNGLYGFASEARRNEGAENLLTPAKLAESLARRDKVPFDQATPAFSGEVDLFAPKPKVRDDVIFREAIPASAISGVVGVFPEANTATLVSDTTPTPHDESVRPRKQARRANTATRIALAAILAEGTIGTVVLAQDGSPQPSPIVPPSIEPGASPTDQIIAVLPCPTPEVSPSPSPSPTPVIIAVAEDGQTVTVALPQAADSPAPSIGELFPTLSPAPTDPITGAIICPSPSPSAPASIEPSPSPSPASPEASKSPDPNAPDSKKTLLKSELDPKAKISQVQSIVDSMYKNKKIKALLKGLHASYDDNTKIVKKDIDDFLERCKTEKVRSDRFASCSGNVIDFISYAQQFPLDSGNPVYAEINAQFMKAARTLRSAAIADGVPAKYLDEIISQNSNIR